MNGGANGRYQSALLVLAAAMAVAVSLPGLRATAAPDQGSRSERRERGARLEAQTALAEVADPDRPQREAFRDDTASLAIVPPAGWVRRPVSALNPLSDPPEPIHETARFQLRVGDATLYAAPIPMTSGLVADATAVISVGVARDGSDILAIEHGVRGMHELGRAPGFTTLEHEATYEGLQVRSAILSRAARLVGLRYVWGGNSTVNGMDCSAYLSWVWSVSRYTTDSIWNVSFPITKADLRAGDALNLTIGRDPRRQGHIRLFEAWANGEHSAMWVYEETPPRVVHRVVAYDDRYQPIRLAGLSGAGDARLIPGAPAPERTAAPARRPTPVPRARRASFERCRPVRRPLHRLRRAPPDPEPGANERRTARFDVTRRYPSDIALRCTEGT